MEKIKLEKINDIKIESSIKKLSLFPSGKFIGVSSDCSIRIWDKDYILYFNIFQMQIHFQSIM